MIEYMDADARAQRTVLRVLAFQAVHIPVQAPREFTAHYRGVYDGGWEQLRARAGSARKSSGCCRRARRSMRRIQACAHGLRSPATSRRSTRAAWRFTPACWRRWTTTSAASSQYLQSRGLAENTIFVVTSDNGPEPSNPVAEPDFVRWMGLTGYTRRLEDLGERGSFVFIGPEWANATATGSLFKFTAGRRRPARAA